jgi:hypothetical protein
LRQGLFNDAMPRPAKACQTQQPQQNFRIHSSSQKLESEQGIVLVPSLCRVNDGGVPTTVIRLSASSLEDREGIRQKDDNGVVKASTHRANDTSLDVRRLSS